MSIVAQANKLLRELLAGRYDDSGGEHSHHHPGRGPAPGANGPAPSRAGCPVQHNPSHGGERPGYQADGEPAPGETRQGVMFWSALLHDELEVAIWTGSGIIKRQRLLCTTQYCSGPPTGLLYAGNGPARSRRDAGDPGTVHPERLGPDEQGRGHGGGAAAQRHWPRRTVSVAASQPSPMPAGGTSPCRRPLRRNGPG